MSNDKELYTECQKRIIEIRQKSGYNRKDFCDEFDIPYRTVTEWERGNRNAPEYVIRLLEYYIAMNNLDERMKRSEGTSGYIETNRLLIRRFREDDAKLCYKGWGQDDRLGRYIFGYPMKKEDMNSFVKSMSRNENAYVIVEKESSSCVGYISVDIPYLQLNIGEIGYVIGEKYQKKGYAYEAVSRILEEYFIKKNIYMLEARYSEDNIASAKLLKKLGFVQDGKLRNRRIDLLSGERKDMIVCSMTYEEYKEITGD